jgi:Peptidase family M1 domain
VAEKCTTSKPINQLTNQPFSNMKIKLLCLFLLGAITAQAQYNAYKTAEEKFRQLDQELPTPNTYRTASGAPGHQYWQQRADYDIKVRLDDETQRLYGEETITYINNSPDALTYLWLQLDQNFFEKESDAALTRTGSITEKTDTRQLKGLYRDFDGGFKIDFVNDANDKKLPYTINKTMMRVDLATPLAAEKSFVFKVKWWFNINDRMKLGGRSGYEYFEEDKNYLYTMAQFFPRMCKYSDVTGWQHKQFLGSGEFTLDFGNYDLSITVPSDHVVGATGVQTNMDAVLTAEQKKRWELAQKTTDKPILIVTQEEAEKAEKNKAKDTKTWTWHADNVRDVAFACSRKFIWDAMAVKFPKNTAMAQSLYPKEGNPMWGQFSTRAVAHTLKTYSKYTIDYPYPSAYSVNGKDIGMEYPMMCFNFGRCEKDGTYDERMKNGMLGVIIHEVGHNFFPMIVNSDERQWTWMDEGLNSFVQYLTEREWDTKYPSRRGPAYLITDYMRSDKALQTPIMTNSESILQFGPNGYFKPATGLNILRETIMGRELFDKAFKEYSTRWAFKHPTPSDFFRTMEDASAVDLDWFWRGWFYTVEPCDIALEEVKWYKMDTNNPDIERPLAEKAKKEEGQRYIRNIREEKDKEPTFVDKDPGAQDFYHKFNPFAVSSLDKKEYEAFLKTLSADDKMILDKGDNYYQITFKNVGGLVMPVIVELEYTDGTKDLYRIPAEIWRYNADKVSKIFVSNKELRQVTLDPFLETSDTDTSNNFYPEKPKPSRMQIFKQKQSTENQMQRAKK